MSNRFDGDRNPEWEGASVESLRSIEATIRAAKFYVVPSDDLRPRVLETARERSSDRRAEGNAVRLMVLLGFCCLLMVPLFQTVARWKESLEMVSASNVQMRATEIATEKHLQWDWGLIEAIQERRQEHAARLHPFALENKYP